MPKLKVFSGLILSLISLSVFAETPISLFPSQSHSGLMAAHSDPLPKITTLVKHNFNTEQFRHIKAQIIYNAAQQPDHVLVYLFSKKSHHVDIARVNIDSAYAAESVLQNYALTTQDFEQQPGITAAKAVCPDNSIQFIALSPNYDELELQITNEVADAALSHHLKVARLLTTTATRTNYINYMACPNLKGNFYDGDANSQVIITYDGAVSAKDINTLLRNQFKFKTVNIWLACEAYNNPLKSSMLRVAQSQKYAAGINDLTVGPSDRTAACAMEAAMDGKSLRKCFHHCYKKFDEEDDHWGFGGLGSDYFGA